MLREACLGRHTGGPHGLHYRASRLGRAYHRARRSGRVPRDHRTVFPGDSDHVRDRRHAGRGYFGTRLHCPLGNGRRNSRGCAFIQCRAAYRAVHLSSPSVQPPPRAICQGAAILSAAWFRFDFRWAVHGAVPYDGSSCRGRCSDGGADISGREYPVCDRMGAGQFCAWISGHERARVRFGDEPISTDSDRPCDSAAIGRGSCRRLFHCRPKARKAREPVILMRFPRHSQFYSL